MMNGLKMKREKRNDCWIEDGLAEISASGFVVIAVTKQDETDRSIPGPPTPMRQSHNIQLPKK